jgi:hypothetical protein
MRAQSRSVAIVLITALGLLGWFALTKTSFSLSSASRVAATPSVRRSMMESREPKDRLSAEVLLKYLQHTYQERNVTISGPLWSVSGEVMAPVARGFYLGGRGELMTGDTTYDGQYLDLAGTGQAQKASGPSKENIYDVAALAQYRFLSDGPLGVSGFSGLGYFYHDNKVSMRGGYRREISQIYLPLGLNGEIGLSRGWKLKAEGEMDFLADGKTKSHLSEVGAGNDDFENEQSSGFGFRLGLRACYRISTVALEFGPYYSYWRVEDSDVVQGTVDGQPNYMYEPQNITSRFGFSFGVSY